MGKKIQSWFFSSWSTSLSIWIVASGNVGWAFDSRELERLIDQQDVRSVEQLLPLLPKELLANHSLVFGSQSLHGSDLASPRVVAFGKKADLILTFNGDPKHPHFYNLDLLEFDSKGSSFVPIDVSFSPAMDRKGIVTRNPEGCTQCHQSLGNASVLPRFEAYVGRIYPAVYGSLEGGMGEKERQSYLKFLEAKPAHSRYRVLPELDSSSNRTLGTLLLRGFWKNLAKWVGSQKELRPYRYAMLASLMCGRPAPNGEWDSRISGYVPSSFPASLGKVVQDVESTRSWTHSVRARRQAAQFGDLSVDELFLKFPLVPDPSQAAASFAYLSEGLLSKIPMGFDYKSAIFHRVAPSDDDGFGGFSNLAEFLYPEALSQESDAELKAWFDALKAAKPTELAPFFSALTTDDLARVCPKLKALSLAEIGSPRQRRE